MSQAVDYLTERLRKVLNARRTTHLARMVKGVPQEEYLRLCGAHAEIEYLHGELNAAIQRLNASEDDEPFDAEGNLKLT